MSATRMVNFVEIQRRGERFVFFYDDGCEDILERVVTQFSKDPQLSFNFTDRETIMKSVLNMAVRRGDCPAEDSDKPD